MGLLNFLADLRAARLVDEISKQVARRVTERLHQACAARVGNMTHAEAHGYLWAKVRPLLTTEVAAVATTQPSLGTGAIAVLHERTRDRVVRTVLAEVMHNRIRHEGLRRAA